MPLFNISPSEALLIGCSVGEYLEAKRDNEYANILYFLSKRLRPFVPTLETETTSEISASECDLQEMEWTELPEGDHIGLSSSEPNCLYRRHGSKTTKTTWDTTRRSLLDLVGDLVEPCVHKSFRDAIEFPSPGSKGLSQAAELLSGFKYDNVVEFLSDFQTPEHPDNTDDVVRVIGELMGDSRNSFDATYEAGQSFGQLLAEIERWHLGVCREWYAMEAQAAPGHSSLDSLLEREAWTQFLDNEYRNGEYLWKDMSGAEARDRCNKSIERLKSHRCVQACLHADMSLSFVQVQHVGFDNDESLQWLATQAKVSLAMGAVLGSMGAEDEEAHAKDAASPIPRRFMLSSTASPERIKGHILETEQILNERARFSVSPEYVVSASDNVIEGLAKTVWGSEFSSAAHKGVLRRVLQDHLRSQDEAERRFASVALSLYLSYRIPSEHEIANFRCTWGEALFFHLGMRTLLELSEIIRKKRASK